MEITQEIIINKSIADCWAVLGDQYTEVYKWASAVHHAEGDGNPGINGASCDVRGCSVEGIGEIEERLIAFDPQAHFLAYMVTKGLPAMMQEAKNSWKLTAINHHQTRLNMKATIQPRGLLANLMKPMIRMQFSKLTRHLTEEFKHYVETGQPHPRKLKIAGKMAA